MTIEQLDAIVQTKSEKQIRQELEARGFAECKDIEELKQLNVVSLIRTAQEESTQFYTVGNHDYKGTIMRNAEGVENWVFIWVEILEDNLPNRILLYAQKLPCAN